VNHGVISEIRHLGSYYAANAASTIVSVMGR
jgi:hypothetical protein